MWSFLWVPCKPHLPTQAHTSLIWEVWPGSNTFILPCPHPLPTCSTTAFLLGGILARRLHPNYLTCAHWSYEDTPKLRVSSLLHRLTHCLPYDCLPSGTFGWAQGRSVQPLHEQTPKWRVKTILGTWLLQTVLLESPLTWRGCSPPSPQSNRRIPLSLQHCSPKTEDLAGKTRSPSLSGFPT